MKILGLTGSIACGKSTVAKWLEQHGAVVIDADALVHELYRDPAFTEQIGQSFGTFVIGKDGVVDRKALGNLVFGNPHKMAKLEKIVHPAVTALRDQRVQEIRQSAKPPEVLVLDAVKLVESGQYKICQAVWCLVVDRANQIDRLIHKRNLTHKEALQRIVVQPPSEKKNVQTDIPIIYIDNNGSMDELVQNVERLWQEFGEKSLMTFLKAAKQVDITAKNNGSHALQSHEITSASEVIARLIKNIETVIFGKTEVVEGCLIGLLAGGHILLEDVPGVGKTMLARSLAKSLGATYKRIQFTPDLLPSDVTGSLVFDQSSSKFHFREGPIFANIVLADEINRTSPKTQSALLECMEEGQITADLVTHLLPRPFFVIATQNPTEYEGVFPLPESQLDRFIIRLSIGYPDAQAEKELLREQRQHHPITEMESVTTAEQVLDLQTQVRRVLVNDAIYDYILRLANATRNHPQLMLGLSPRGSLALARAAQAHALIRQREFVTPDDVKAVASAVIAHRIIPLPEARQNRNFTEQIVGELLQSVAVD